MQKPLFSILVYAFLVMLSTQISAAPLATTGLTGDWAEESVENLKTDVIFDGTPVKISDLIAKATYDLVQINPANPSFILASCTAVLIDKDILLTAAHCIPAKGLEMLIRYYSVKDKTTKTLKVVQSVAHQQYDSVNIAGRGPTEKNDIAILQTEKAIPGGVRALLPKADLKIPNNQKVIDAGFGFNKPAATMADAMKDPQILALIAKYGSNMTQQQQQEVAAKVLEIIMLHPLLSTESSASLLTDVEPDIAQMMIVNNEHPVCEGDSGGPSFLQQSSGPLVVLGIHSTSTDAACKDNSAAPATNPAHGYDIYVPTYVNWIKANITKLQGQDI